MNEFIDIIVIYIVFRAILAFLGAWWHGDGRNDFNDNRSERAEHNLRMIAISKIEEFASILDDSIDTTALEKVPFEQRIPVGMYAFTYLEENGMEI